MVSLLYNNIDLEVYKSYAISTVSAVAENPNTDLDDSVQPLCVAARKSKHVTAIDKITWCGAGSYRWGKARGMKHDFGLEQS